MKALAILALFAAACGGTSDPCASEKGTCLALEIRGSVAVNSLTVSASKAVTEHATSVGAATSLPVQLAVTFPAGVSGPLHLDVVGDLNGTVAGEGSTDTTLVSGEHTHATITLEALGDLGASDLSVDQRVPDLASHDAAPACVVACVNATSLQTCGEADLGDAGTSVESCDHGCIDDSTGPHCVVFVPTAPVTPSDAEPHPGFVDVISAATTLTVMNTDTGAITHAGYVNRVANQMGSVYEVESGIGFRVEDGVGIFVMKSFDLPSGGTVILEGTSAAAIVASGDITIDGILDARPYSNTTLCPSSVAAPGGAVGGTGGQGPGPGTYSGGLGQGPGGGKPGSYAPGDGGKSGTGGGAGHGAKGGDGTGTIAFYGAGGAAYDALPSTTFRGGSGGGGGGTGGGFGGSGGGAVHLASGSKITIGSAGTTGGVDVGGCGATGTSGGGSGGSILLEAPSLLLSAHGVLAANGGGTSSNPGALDATAQSGGGAGDVCQATTGAGAAGTIQLNATTGGAIMSTSFVLSPSVVSGCAATGTITLE